MRSWAHVPTDRVVHLTGVDLPSLMEILCAQPDDTPATLTLDARDATSASEFIDDFLGEMQRTCIESVAAWLPDAVAVGGSGGVTVSAVRSIARTAALRDGHHRPLFGDLAVAAVCGAPFDASRFGAEARAVGFSRVICAATARPTLVIICHIHDRFAGHEEALLNAAEWLIDHANIGVWLIGRPRVASDRVTTVDLGWPAWRPAVASVAAGQTHPGSPTERLLEAALSKCAWAAGRAWNQPYQAATLMNPVRLDLLWSAEKCVVEIDGPEHRAPNQFAADRRRDVYLQISGFAVLRFTNEQVQDDVWNVVALIERYVRARRFGPREGQLDAG
ncbi:DUF559 domain-containing protein [Dactylosporangium sp. NPDC050588]|uniref:endonuclease domain-containing protein n=1 Tax=Dactylosporangium sp. NPDC050588 TaxID=3157211 RepID=UPI0033E3F501